MKKLIGFTLVILMLVNLLFGCDAVSPDVIDTDKVGTLDKIEPEQNIGMDKQTEIVACEHIDEVLDHFCDKCYGNVGIHADTLNDNDHRCDHCKAIMSLCEDINKDHLCDECGLEKGNHLDDENDGDHLCEYCGKNVGVCVDFENDHICNECGENVGHHADFLNDGDHLCEYCKNIASYCIDENKDCACDECGKISHNIKNGYCLVCSKRPYMRNDNKITFGIYPQSKVEDGNLINTLNSMAGELPTYDNANLWTSYGYYSNGEIINFMWYIDVEERGEKYRGVYFTDYRPNSFDGDFGERFSYQDDNGYYINMVYWFKYEPISWTIISEDSTKGTALLLCDMIMDAQAFQDVYVYGGAEGAYDCTKYYNGLIDVPSDTYANNYVYSTIRKWLNDNFYNTAFDDLQLQIILTTIVDNSLQSTGYNSNPYLFENTEDKIFLISAKDMVNTDSGFQPGYYDWDVARVKKSTDYAKVQGAYSSSSGSDCWWLRSPYNGSSHDARLINCDGGFDSDFIECSWCGVVPSVQIQL